MSRAALHGMKYSSRGVDAFTHDTECRGCSTGMSRYMHTRYSLQSLKDDIEKRNSFSQIHIIQHCQSSTTHNMPVIIDLRIRKTSCISIVVDSVVLECECLTRLL